jgi:hypothetical protein
VVGEGVVETASNVDADAVTESVFGSEDRSAGHQPERLGKLGTVGNLQLELLARGEKTFAKFLNVERCVDEEHIFVSRRLWSDEVGWFGGIQLEEAIVSSLVFVGRKDVGADR